MKNQVSGRISIDRNLPLSIQFLNRVLKQGDYWFSFSIKKNEYIEGESENKGHFRSDR